MAVKRKRGSASGRRRLRVRRGFFRPRRFAGVRRSRLGSSRVHSFKRMVTTPTVITGAAAYNPYLSSSTAWLGQLVNFSEFTQLYDQYRINYVVYKYYLKIDPSAQTAATASYPKLYWYRDLDDSNAPASLSEMRENARTRVAVMNPNRPVVIKYRPNTLAVLYTSAVASQYKPVYKQWMDVAQTGTPHYGHKIAIDDLTNVNYKVETEITYYFQCRNPR